MQSHPRYQMLDKIASGSFATVYRGRDLELGREVAIKQIHEQFLADPQQLDRYWAEAQLLASFQHPNIVTIYDIVRERGWLILELMQSDLSKIAGRKQMPLESLKTTLAHGLRALKFLHSNGIVHGDVKPSNMMIDRRRRVKLGDFGLARRVSNEQGSLIKGTTKYMAPEVVSDEFGEVGPASDLYSLGFAAYELMCGENFEELFPGLKAFGRDRQMAWMMWHATPDRRLPEIDRVLADVPEDLARTIQKLTAKSQSQRYKSADEALSDLNIDIKLIRSGEESADNLGRSTVVQSGNGNRRLLIITAAAVSVILSVTALFFLPDGSESPPPLEKARPVAGVVREVLANEDKLVIENELGIPSEVAVAGKQRVRLDEGRWILLRELAQHDRVEIRIDETKGSRVVNIAARRPSSGRGKIKDIDPEASKLTATLLADPQPQDVPMYIPAGATLILNGKSVSIAELQPYDHIEVTHVKDTEGRAARDVIKLTALRTVSIIGFIDDIVSRDGTHFLIVVHLRHQTTIEMTDDCRISIDGQTQEEGKPFTAGKLQKGDRVHVQYDARATTVTAVRRDALLGATLKRVDQSGHEIIVQPDHAEETTFAIAEDCEISRNDKPATFEELEKGDVLDISFSPQEGQPAKAKTIDARPSK